MSDKTFKIGDRVGVANQKFHCDDRPQVGVVTDITMTNKVCAKWDKHYHNNFKGNPYYESSYYVTEEEANARWDLLNDEWQVIEEEIQKKMTVAGNAIIEAEALAKAKGYNIVQLYEAIHPLMNALDAAGWRTSSLGC